MKADAEALLAEHKELRASNTEAKEKCKHFVLGLITQEDYLHFLLFYKTQVNMHTFVHKPKMCFSPIKE